MSFPLVASFSLPLPSFTPPNIWCFCIKAQQGTTVIAYLFVPCISAPSAFLRETSRVGASCGWGGTLSLGTRPRSCWDKGRTWQGLLPLGSLGRTVPAVAASPLPGKMRISLAAANFAGCWLEALEAALGQNWAGDGGQEEDTTSIHHCHRGCLPCGLPSPGHKKHWELGIPYSCCHCYLRLD